MAPQAMGGDNQPVCRCAMVCLRPVLTSLALLAPLVLHAPPARPAVKGIGRWQATPAECRSQLDGQPAGPCQRLVIDQRLDGVLAIRFLTRGAQPEAASQITFAGNADGGLTCASGRCRLDGPVTVVLSSLSEVEFDANGVARELPRGWPVVGECRLERTSLSCQAKAPEGQQWQAEARF
jgi:hypothetical protein